MNNTNIKDLIINLLAKTFDLDSFEVESEFHDSMNGNMSHKEMVNLFQEIIYGLDLPCFISDIDVSMDDIETIIYKRDGNKIKILKVIMISEYNSIDKVADLFNSLKM